MASVNKKVTALTEQTDVAADDLFYTVDDPASLKDSYKVTFDTMMTAPNIHTPVMDTTPQFDSAFVELDSIDNSVMQWGTNYYTVLLESNCTYDDADWWFRHADSTNGAAYMGIYGYDNGTGEDWYAGTFELGAAPPGTADELIDTYATVYGSSTTDGSGNSFGYISVNTVDGRTSLGNGRISLSSRNAANSMYSYIYTQANKIVLHGYDQADSRTVTFELGTDDGTCGIASSVATDFFNFNMDVVFGDNTTFNDDASFTKNVTFSDNIIENVYALGGTEIDPENGTIQTKVLSGNTTFTYGSGFVAGSSVVLMINPNSTYTVTWPTTNWAGGSAPTLSAASTGEYDIVVITKVGTEYYAKWLGMFT